MLRTSTLREQTERAADDPLRVLIVGAGMAGLTLAQLLRRRGLHPVLVERAAPDADRGYMLALLPLVEPLLTELELHEAYTGRSQRFRRYRILGRHGQQLTESRMDQVVGDFGDYRGISRGKLLQTLGSAASGGITYGATVTELRQRSGHVQVTMAETATNEESAESATTRAEFDLVVIADGLHSTTRDLVLERDQVEVFDAGWGGWVTWMEPDQDPDLGEELWGNDVFIGTYPVADSIGIFLGGPRDRTRAGAARFVADARERIGMSSGEHVSTAASRVEGACRAVSEADDSYFWPMVDGRAKQWARGRVVLLGDAAAGFLPTAGIGAGMAMESAWVLAHQLDAPDGAPGAPVLRPSEVPARLRAYEQAQRPRVQAAQQNSRSLARIMFRGGASLAVARDLVARLVPVSAALKPIRTLLQERPVVGQDTS